MDFKRIFPNHWRNVFLSVIISFFLQIPFNYATAQPPGYFPPVSGLGLASGLFALNQMDMHIHAGMERELPLDEWIDLSVKDGRRVMLLLDHIELYRMDSTTHAQWVSKNKVTDWYPPGPAGYRALMSELEGAEQRRDVITFRGWEIWEGELDEELERDAMRLAEVIGWHISPNNGGAPPDGEKLLRRTEQILAVQKEFKIPMIIFHPFSMRIENLIRTAQKTGKDIASLSETDFRFFMGDQAAALLALLKGSSVYIEISSGLKQYWHLDAVRSALLKDIRPLVEGGAQFIVSTDAHGLRSFKNTFDPAIWCTPLGITPENTNMIVRELLAIRALNRMQRVGYD